MKYLVQELCKFLKQFGEIIISWDKSKTYIRKKTVPLEKVNNFGFSPFLGNGGMIVVEIWYVSGAQDKGLSIDDVILKINDLEVKVNSQNYVRISKQSQRY